MLLMKKDMGGAAAALGARRDDHGRRAAGAPARAHPRGRERHLGRAFRPGDVLPSRKGLTVEIGNTDAEGRLILADALALADEEEPDLIVDFATLTGAARVALGPELPPFYTDDDALAADLAALGRRVERPGLAAAALAALRELLDFEGRRHQQRSGRADGRLGHRRAVPARASSTTARRWSISTSSPGTRRRGPAGRRAARSRRARLVYALLKERYGAGALSG